MPDLFSHAFDGSADGRALLLAGMLALAVAYLAARITRRLAARGLAAMLGGTLTTASPAVRNPLRVLGVATFLLVLATVTVPILELTGVRPRTGVRLRHLADWAFTAGLRVILTALIAYAIIRTVGLLVRRFEHEINVGTSLDALERAKRGKTLGNVVRNVTTAVVASIALVMILRELGMNITPVLTGAGILGLAVGFGAQTLVRDIISGFFLILEDQVRVGDVAAINGQGGVVEAINLRTIVLRDQEGTVHVFPNGAITTLANRSKEFSYYVIDLGIPYNEDSDRVVAVLKDVGEQLQKDDAFGPLILAPIEVLGVDAFSDWWVTLKLRIKTLPLKQWDVGRELRRRILKAFEKHGIEIPVPAPIVRASIPTETTPRVSGPGTPGRS